MSRATRRRVLLLAGGAAAGIAVAVRLSPRAQAFGNVLSQTPDLSADLRIFESTTTQSSYPDDCGMRLDRLYIAEDLELSIQGQFSRALSDDESRQVQWVVSNEDAVWDSGDFTEQPNPALVTTTLSPPRAGDRTQASVHVLRQGVDLVPRAPLRVVTNDEYAAA